MTGIGDLARTAGQWAHGAGQLLLAVGTALAIAGLALWLSPLAALLAISALFCAVLVAAHAEAGLLTLVLITGLVDTDRLPLFPLGPFSLHGTDLLLAYLLALTVAQLLVERGKGVHTPLDLPLLWFYGAVLLAAAQAVLMHDAEPNFVLRRLRPLTYYLAFFATTQLVRTRRQLSALVGGLMLIALVASLIMALQLISVTVPWVSTASQELVTAGRTSEGIMRTYLQAERLIYAMLLVALCRLALGVRQLPLALAWLPTGILALGLFLTFQRNYWLTMLLMIGALMFMLDNCSRLRLGGWALGGVLVLLAATFVPGSPLLPYLRSAGDRFIWGMQPATIAQDSSMQLRLMEMAYGWQAIGKQPWVGHGLAYLYRPLKTFDFYQDLPPTIGLRWYLHNAYLWLWVQAGLVALVPFLWLLGSAIGRGLRRWRRLPDPQLQAIVLGNTLALLGQAISNLVAPNFLQSWVLVVFAILLGVNEVILRRDWP